MFMLKKKEKKKKEKEKAPTILVTYLHHKWEQGIVLEGETNKKRMRRESREEFARIFVEFLSHCFLRGGLQLVSTSEVPWGSFNTP